MLGDKAKGHCAFLDVGPSFTNLLAEFWERSLNNDHGLLFGSRWETVLPEMARDRDLLRATVRGVPRERLRKFLLPGKTPYEIANAAVDPEGPAGQRMGFSPYLEHWAKFFRASFLLPQLAQRLCRDPAIVQCMQRLALRHCDVDVGDIRYWIYDADTGSLHIERFHRILAFAGCLKAGPSCDLGPEMASPTLRGPSQSEEIRLSRCAECGRHDLHERGQMGAHDWQHAWFCDTCWCLFKPAAHGARRIMKALEACRTPQSGARIFEAWQELQVSGCNMRWVALLLFKEQKFLQLLSDDSNHALFRDAAALMFTLASMATDGALSALLRGVVRGIFKSFHDVKRNGSHVAGLYIQAVAAAMASSTSEPAARVGVIAVCRRAVHEATGAVLEIREKHHMARKMVEGLGESVKDASHMLWGDTDCCFVAALHGPHGQSPRFRCAQCGGKCRVEGGAFGTGAWEHEWYCGPCWCSFPTTL